MSANRFLEIYRMEAAHSAELTIKQMMGGKTFLLRGNMLGGADKDPDGKDRIMFRVGKANEEEALRFPNTSQVQMGGRTMGGMIFVDGEMASDEDLVQLIRLALTFVGPLPPK